MAWLLFCDLLMKILLTGKFIVKAERGSYLSFNVELGKFSLFVLVIMEIPATLLSIV